MEQFKHRARRALLAAFVAWSPPAMADVAARFDYATGNVVLSGLTREQIAAVLTTPDAVRLSLAGSASERGMLLSLSRHDDLLVATPRFPLRLGTEFILSVLGENFNIDLSPPVAHVPTLLRFSPEQAVIPANTLRFYLHFSQPMAQGQLRNSVMLLRRDGTVVNNPFLFLQTEIWDPSQTRLTLLMDPGRIKLGVGPNRAAGAPLLEGESYRLVVSGAMKSALGIALGNDASVSFRVGPAERHLIDPKAWQVLKPQAGTHAVLTIIFDRIMDVGAIERLMWLEAPEGKRIKGAVMSDGGSWTVAPDVPWQEGLHRLIIDPALEDVAGNTLSAPFDADRGTIGKADEPATIGVAIR